MQKTVIAATDDRHRHRHGQFGALSRVARPDPWPAARRRPVAAIAVAGGAALFMVWAGALPALL